MRGATSYAVVLDTVKFGCSPKALQYGCNDTSAGTVAVSSTFALPEDLEGHAYASGGANASVVDPWTGNRMVAHATSTTRSSAL